MTKHYTLHILGVKKQLTVDQAIEYMKDKPIFEHYSKSKIRRLLKEKDKLGLVTSQCFGVLDINRMLVQVNKDSHKQTLPKEYREIYDLYKSLAMQRLVFSDKCYAAGYCNCGLLKGG